MEPPTACIMRKTTSSDRVGARLHRPGADGEHDKPDPENPLAAHPVGRGPREHQQAGQHQRVGVDNPLQTGDR